MDTFAREKLFPVIRYGMNIDSGDAGPALSDDDVARVLKTGLRQSILPVVCRGLQRLGFAKDSFGEKYTNENMLALYRSVVREDAIDRISKALSGAGIDYILLKGAVLKAMYPEPWIRTSYDVDILVREESLDQAVKAIEAATEFQYTKRNYHDVELLSDRMQLELHFSVKESMDNLDAVLEEAWSNAEPTGNGTQWRFTPEFQVFHIFTHMCYHMTHGGLGIRPFIDLWLLRRKTSYSEGKLREMLEKCGIERFYDNCLRLSEIWLEGAPEDCSLDALEKYCLEGGVLGTAHNTVISNQRNRNGANYVFSRLFVSREIIESTYPKAKKYPVLIPFYQVKRWFRLLDRKTRKSAVNELNLAKKMKDEEVEAFDELLKSVGL